MGKKNKNKNKGPNRSGSLSPREDKIKRDDIGRFASQGKTGKENVPTVFSGPARTSDDTGRVRITSILEKPLPIHVDSERIRIPSGLEKAYESYQKVKVDGVRIELKELVIDLENLLQDIIFQPNSADSEDWCVEWCSEVEMAKGNSVRVAKAIHEALDYDINEDEEKDFMEDKDNPALMVSGWFDCIAGWANSIVTLKFEGPGGPSRIAANVFFAPEGEEWVIDYTARQWDARATFPLIQPRALWEAWIKKHNAGKAFISTTVGA